MNMKKMMAASFEPDQIGGFITIHNGVKVGREGHISKTIMITREGFNVACEDRIKFNDILGIDITTGWQDALGEMIHGCYPVPEISEDTMAKFIVEGEIARNGEETIAKEIEALDKQNHKLAEAVIEEVAKKQMEAQDGRLDGNTKAGKGSKKSRRATDTKLSDDGGAESSAQPDGTDI